MFFNSLLKILDRAVNSLVIFYAPRHHSCIFRILCYWMGGL